jgi:hypothetical protein
VLIVAINNHELTTVSISIHSRGWLVGGGAKPPPPPNTPTPNLSLFLNHFPAITPRVNRFVYSWLCDPPPTPQIINPIIFMKLKTRIAYFLHFFFIGGKKWTIKNISWKTSLYVNYFKRK